MIKKLLATIFVVTSFVSCQKDEPIRCILPKAPTIITENNKYFSRETIVLSASVYEYVGSDIVYKWSGPNGFYSELQNPTLLNATSSMNGDYKLKVLRGICETPEVSVNVEVIDNTVVNCMPIKNSLEISTLYSNVTFSDDLIKTTQGDHTFGLEAYSYSYNKGIAIDFKTEYKQKPKTGIYSVVSKNTSLDYNSVHINIRFYNFYNYTNTYFYANSGKVKVTYLKGKMIVVFCDVPFFNTTSTKSDFSATTNLLED